LARSSISCARPREIREQNDTTLRKPDEVVTRLAAIERDLAAMKVD
jgi:hypothetical protein